tara:strand:- start:357 stop:677 length:321 start_codon:yes stop_codon:yes gene_type:complete
MIPFIRSLSELKAITESRDVKNNNHQNIESYSLEIDSGQRKRYIRSLHKTEVSLPNLPKTIRRRWIKSNENISKFFDDLDYNNQIQSTYDLTLIEIQNKKNQQDVA